MITLLTDILWGRTTYPGPLVLGLLGLALAGVGLYLTVRMRGVQFANFRELISAMRHSFKPGHKDGLSSFRAFATGMGARVGAGNIVGVSIAITLGGPGAVFWMWVVAFLGMGTAVVENTLAQVYKRREFHGGEHVYRGGPAYYMTRGLNARWAGVAFSVVMILAFPIGIVSVQSNTVATAVDTGFGVPTWITGLLTVVVVAFVIFGGIRRISAVSEFIAPIMAAAYVLVGAVVILLNIGDVPTVLADIVLGAFGMREAVGGVAAYAVTQGIIQGFRRGLFSNEAGMGSTPNIAAVGDVKHPVAQGFVQSIGVFIDTMVLCTVTALVVLLGGVWEPGYTSENNGATLAQESLSNVVGSWGTQFIAVGMVFFALTTLLVVTYYGETAVWFLKKDRRLIWAVRGLVLVVTFVSAISATSAVWDLADATTGALAFINLVALVFLSGTAVKLVRDYLRQRREGKEPVFEPAMFPELDLDTDDWQDPEPVSV